MADRALVLLYGGVSFAAMIGAAAIPVLAGADGRYVLAVTAFLVGLQAAQSAAIQTSSRSCPSRGVRLGLVGGSACLAVAGGLVDSIPLMIGLCTGAGAFAGFVIGRASSLILASSGSAAFQRYVAVRSVLIVAASLGSSLMAKVSPATAIILVGLLICCIALAMPQADEGLSVRARFAPDWVFLLGLLGSLYYRNDVNWIRTSLFGGREFETWHLMLLAYSGAQAMVGFAVVHIFFVNREVWRQKVQSVSPVWCGAGLVLWVMSVTPAAFLAPRFSVVVSVAACVVLAGVVGLLSGAAHTYDMSWAPYLAGILGATWVLVSLFMGMDERRVLVLENGFIGALILSALAAQLARRRWL